jgi:hypothetical protein
MTPGRKAWGLYIALGLNGAGIFAQQPIMVPPSSYQPATSVRMPTEVFRGKMEDLSKHSFHLGGLLLTLNGYRWGVINLRGENTTKNFLEFHPDDLLVVNSKKRQVDIGIGHDIGSIPRDVSSLVPISHLAPDAFVEISYFMDVFKEPFITIYYGDKLLAEITSPPLEPNDHQ